MKKKKNKKNDQCFICGEKIKNDSNHYCRKLKEELDDEIDTEKLRTYGDKMEEFDKYFNPDKYFDIQ